MSFSFLYEYPSVTYRRNDSAPDGQMRQNSSMRYGL